MPEGNTRILVDGRALLDPRGGGVFEYASRALSALRTTTPFSYHAWANQAQPVAAGMADAVTRWPNKLLHAGIRLAGAPKIERVAGESADLLWMPNPHFVSTGLPLVLTVHDLSFEFYPEFFSLKQRLWHRAVDPAGLCRRAAAIVAVSENTKKDLVERYGISPERVFVASPGVSLPASGSLPPDLPERFILHVGALEPRKNHLALLEAFRLLKGNPRNRDLGLVLAGPSGWRNADIRRAIAAHPFRDRIVHLGFVPPGSKAALYRRAAVMAFPSFYEGFGLPPLEAMAAGTPVVASFAASLGEVVADAGLLIDPYRPAELAEALSAVLDSPTLSENLSARGRARAAAFTWEQCAKKTAAAFNAALKGVRPPGV